MNIGYLVISLVLFVLSISCITTTVVEMIQGGYGMVAPRFWYAVIFHAMTGVAAVLLLARARQVKRRAG